MSTGSDKVERVGPLVLDGKFDHSGLSKDLHVRSEFRKRLGLCLMVHGLRPAALARKTGLSNTVISNHLKGKILPNRDSALRYAAEFNVSLEWLYGQQDVTDAPWEIPEHLRYDLQPITPMPIAKNIATPPRLPSKVAPPVTKENPFSCFARVPDSAWKDTGIWMNAKNMHGDELNELREAYNHLRPIAATMEHRVAFRTVIRNRALFLGSENPTRDLREATGIRSKQIEDYVKGTRYPYGKNLFLIAAALKLHPRLLESELRNVWDTKAGSVGSTYRKLHPDIEAHFPEPVPVDGSIDDRLAAICKLAWLAKQGGQSSTYEQEYFKWYEILKGKSYADSPYLWSQDTGLPLDPAENLDSFAEEFEEMISNKTATRPRGF